MFQDHSQLHLMSTSVGRSSEDSTIRDPSTASLQKRFRSVSRDLPKGPCHLRCDISRALFDTRMLLSYVHQQFSFSDTVNSRRNDGDMRQSNYKGYSALCRLQLVSGDTIALY
jgi:hypothetical protein